MRAVSWSDLLRMRSLALCAVMLCLLVAPPVRAADEPYDFYAIVSLTGQAAFIGHANQVAMGAIEQLINRTGGIAGRPLHFVIEDDQSSTAVAVQLANQLFVKGVPAILGPDSAGTCVALLPMVSSGPIMYCMAN